MSMDLIRRFSFGVNLDDTWRYSGVSEPKSIIFPHLLSLSLRERGRFEKVEEATIKLRNQAIPQDEADRASLALADSLRSIGADFVRCWFPWRFFEPVPVPEADLGSLLDSGYERWPTDGLVRALVEQGISVLPVLACGYERMLPHGLSPDAGEEEYLKRAETHARALVRHYRGKISTWQIENEPNWWAMHEVGGWRTGASWLEGPGFRDALLKVLNDAVHEEDPQARTMTNLEADEEKLEVAEFAKYCDIVGLDFYPNYKASEPVDAAVIRRAQDVSKETGKPVMIAETGYPSGPSLLGYSEKKQADYVQRVMREAFSLEGVTGIGIWRYLDTSWSSFPPQENHFGLIDEKEGPKEAWYRYGQALKELKG
ncbi:MAG: endo-1,4-beta-xylanase [Nitrososphaerota archaeon]|nr:endo-1,4-beta-xylanase [Nitrososphaerota archaeon]MDG6975806.1 endo-1,4-beta-xylanase [Nitrososphaerota archaeon]MDG6980614.1 endo-1,4-beta-xylanase [Nitrososphaerota archaeon]